MIKVIETGFKGLVVIKPSLFQDSRGYFTETFNFKDYQQAGISFNPVQDNESSSAKGVIRGLHYQLSPFTQTKLIRVVEGKILDIALDIRRKSMTFGKWFGIELDSDSKDQVLIPEGFAHGFSVLSERAVIQYKCSNYYNPGAERGVHPLDPELDINWKLGSLAPIISEKDLKHPVFRDAEYNF